MDFFDFMRIRPSPPDRTAVAARFQ